MPYIKKPITDLNKLAKNYNLKRALKPSELETILTSIERALNITQKQKVVDLGCGSGRLIIPLAKRHPTVTFVCVELADGMIDSLTNEIKKSHLTNISVIKHDLNKALPLATEEFDVAILYHVFHIVSKKRKLAQEINRVIKKNGKLLVASTSHTQLATTLNYKYIPQMLKKEYKRTPDLKTIISIFRSSSFYLMAINEVLIKKDFKNIDDWMNFLAQRPISALTFFSDTQLTQQLKAMKKNILNIFGDVQIEYVYDYHTQLVFTKI